jgi:hypothetical protein
MEFDDEDAAEKQQLVSAVAASMACDLPRLYLREGTKQAVNILKPRVVSKYEYNQRYEECLFRELSDFTYLHDLYLVA